MRSDKRSFCCTTYFLCLYINTLMLQFYISCSTAANSVVTTVSSNDDVLIQDSALGISRNILLTSLVFALHSYISCSTAVDSMATPTLNCDNMQMQDFESGSATVDSVVTTASSNSNDTETQNSTPGTTFPTVIHHS